MPIELSAHDSHRRAVEWHRDFRAGKPFAADYHQKFSVKALSG
jgi:hypothetical protein